jgi:hypothetical protein
MVRSLFLYVFLSKSIQSLALMQDVGFLADKSLQAAEIYIKRQVFYILQFFGHHLYHYSDTTTTLSLFFSKPSFPSTHISKSIENLVSLYHHIITMQFRITFLVTMACFGLAVALPAVINEAASGLKLPTNPDTTTRPDIYTRDGVAEKDYETLQARASPFQWVRNQAQRFTGNSPVAPPPLAGQGLQRSNAGKLPSWKSRSSSGSFRKSSSGSMKREASTSENNSIL